MVSILSNYTDEEFTFIVQQSTSISEVERKLGYNSYSGSVATNIRNRIRSLNIDTSHFYSGKLVEIRSEENIFIENSTATQATLRKWYKKGNYTPYICAICGQEPIWQGKELTLILDHVNGNNKDDRLENLRWVCPNCNQQLETTGSKNNAYGQEKMQIVKKCVDCGKEISKDAIRCKSCSIKHRQNGGKRCSRDELKALIRIMPFTQIGKKFGVSDNAVRKWCDEYDLPRKALEIKKISDEEWLNI